MVSEPWLAETWKFVVANLPPVPASVLEIGCGPAGGFVPALTSGGYGALGVDPEAPEGPCYRRERIEGCDLESSFDAVIACTSLHHVENLGSVLDDVNGKLLPGGVVIVIEWARERIDEATAKWCFSRLAPSDPDGHPSWLSCLRDQHTTSTDTWAACCSRWADERGLHTGSEVLRAADDRFARRSCRATPYLWADLPGTSVADEQEAIDMGLIQATGIYYAGRKRDG